ncbi:hypothetical protein D3C86_1594020 [compost metagenome]
MNHAFPAWIDRLAAQRLYPQEDETASVQRRNRQQIEYSQVQAKNCRPIGQILNPLLRNLAGHLECSYRTGDVVHVELVDQLLESDEDQLGGIHHSCA